MAQAPLTSTSVPVKVSQPWTDTGVDILDLDKPIRITADGTIDVGLVSRRAISPKGDSACEGGFGTPRVAPELPCWSLLGRIGNGGTPFLIGKSLTIEPKDLGRLFVGVNDELYYFSDNAGEWSVTIALPQSGADGPPNPVDVLGSPAAVAALKRAFGGVARSTVLARIDVREDWEIRGPQHGRVLPLGVVELATELPGPDARSWDDTDAAVRQGLESVEALTAAAYGVQGKAFLIRVMVESLVEALPLIPTADVSKLSSVLERLAREGLTPEVQKALVEGKRPTYVVAASAKAAATVKLGGPDDLLMLRYRATEGRDHLYDVYATWSETAAPGTKHTDYGDVRLADGQQGYARHQLSVSVDPKGAFSMKPAPMKAHYATSPNDLWLHGEFSALVK